MLDTERPVDTTGWRDWIPRGGSFENGLPCGDCGDLDEEAKDPQWLEGKKWALRRSKRGSIKTKPQKCQIIEETKNNELSKGQKSHLNATVKGSGVHILSSATEHGAKWNGAAKK